MDEKLRSQEIIYMSSYIIYYELNALSIRSLQQTSDLLLQVHDDLDGHVEDAELRLGFVCLEVCHAHPPKLLQCFIDVPDPYPISTHHIQQSQDTLVIDMPAIHNA